MSRARDFVIGPLAFRLDPGTGMVRNVRFHGHEIVRGIYPAVRDADWATVSPTVPSPDISASAGIARVRMSGRVSGEGIDLEWNADIEATAGGSLRYRWSGCALRDFATNRTGLCVLHPAEIAGTACVIEHPDGRTEATAFPQTVSPHQPFREVRAITHEAAPGLTVGVRLEGEVFETEDQRNWTDASFKTYCRPLDWPRPYQLKSGTTIEHTVTVTARGTPPTRPVMATGIRLSRALIATRLPRIGFGLPGPIPENLRKRVRALRPSHVRIEVSPEQLPEMLAWARADAELLNCELEVALRGATSTVLARSNFPAQCSLHLFDEQGNSAPAEVVSAWRGAGFTAIGTGTLNHFVALNRQPPATRSEHDWTTFGINAQVHTFDDQSVIETLSQHGVVARQAQALGGGRPVAIAPIVLGPSADSTDGRLHGQFAARWVLGSLVRLAAAGGVDRVTFFRTHGPGGFLRGDGITPAEHLFRVLAGNTGKHFTLGTEPGRNVDALLVAAGNDRRLLVAHEDENAVPIEIPFGGAAGTLGHEAAPFSGGHALVPPHAVWQLHLSP
ncbi:MAG: hypothetical protein Q7S40_16545 [Opitutaceae bacterium]|nr:hypothetical protein [Opitutaceae bacterium]